MVNTEGVDLSANRLLSIMPQADLERLVPSISIVSLEQGTVLSEPGEEADRVWFPHTGMISLLAIMADGKGVETATVGPRESSARWPAWARIFL